MVTREDVASAYRFLLGREPESEDVVQEAIRGYCDIAHLRKSFLNSPEFAAKNGSLIMERRFPHDLDEGGFPIEVACEGESLRKLVAHVEKTWSRLGAEEPHWSVITADEFKAGSFQQNQKAFWESGRGDVVRLKSWLKRNRIALSAASCVEFGCGTGRITRWLAKEASTLIACDISNAHLSLAREAVVRDGISNVAFLLTRGIDALDELPPYDLMFSLMVLQHNPPPVIARILEKLLARLKPGGVAYFQVPTFRAGYGFSVSDYLSSRRCGTADMEMHVLPQRDIFQIASRNSCDLIEVEPDNYTGSMDFVSCTFLLRKRGG